MVTMDIRIALATWLVQIFAKKKNTYYRYLISFYLMFRAAVEVECFEVVNLKNQVLLIYILAL